MARRRAQSPHGGTRHDHADIRLRQLPRVLSLLPAGALRPHLPAPALPRQHAGAGVRGDRAGHAQRLVAAGRAGGGICLRLGRALRLREEPARI